MKRPLLVAVLLGLAAGVMSSPAAAQAGSNSLDAQLIQAASHGNTAEVQQLLDKGANVNAADGRGNRPLHWAATYASHYQTKVAALLLQRGADVNARNKSQETPLHRAARDSNTEMVALLLQNGADVNARDESQSTPLHWAAERGEAGNQAEVMALLIQKAADVNARNEWQRIPLHEAVKYHNAEALAATALLIQKGADIKAKDKDQKTPLHNAGSKEIAELLIQKGADVNARDNGQWTPLHQAAGYQEAEVVTLLIQRGADVNARNNNQETPLHFAARNGKIDAAAILIKNGADVNARDKDQRTPAMWAEKEKHPALAAMLSEAGGSAPQDMSAVARATHEAEYADELRAGLEKGEDINSLLYRAVANGESDKVDFLVRKGADVNSRGKDQQSPLLRAVSDGKTELVKLLLDRGANIEAKDTALIAAVRSSEVEIVKLLLNRGANIEAKTNDGDTALVQAVWYVIEHERTLDVVKLLLDKGANTEAKNRQGDTALLTAAYRGRPDLVKLLLDKGANVEAREGQGFHEMALQVAARRRDGVVCCAPDLTSEQRATLLSRFDEAIQLLQGAVLRDSRTNFPAYVSEFQSHPYEERRRETVIKLAASLRTPPAIPDEARQLFLQASALMKQTNTPEELAKPIELLSKALVIAPWWGNAYYNLARALELSGQYDEAVKQLNYYLELKPSEADATEARARIAVIQTEKETAAQKRRENEGVLAVKYVSGGITRLRYHDAPAWWHESGRVDALYTYMVPEESPFYVNVFRMPTGHLLTISLLALSHNGAYTGDQIAVYAWDETKGGCSEGYMFAFGAHSYTDACGVHYDVSVSNQPNAIVTITYTPTGGSVTIPVALLYRGRVLQVGWDSTGTVYQGSHDKGVEVLHFDGSMVEAAKNPNVNAMGLTPTSVIPHKK